MNRFRLRVAGLLAVLLGVPLTQQAYAQDGFDIFFSALDLGLAIADSSGGS